MPLDLLHAASTIAFAHPVPAIMQRYEEKPATPWFASFAESFEIAPSAAELTIDKLGGMLSNWDGYGALPLTAETLQNAKATLRFVQMASPTPDITPNPNGTISFEWESERGSAHLEVGKTKMSFYIAGLFGEPIFLQSDTGNLSDVGCWVDQMVSNYLYPPQAHAVSAIQVGLHAYGRAATRYR